MDPNLKQAIDDSYRLMAFLGRVPLVMDRQEDRDLFDAHTASIAQAQAGLAAGQTLTGDQQAAFWRAFISLSNIGSPATIESIRYYQDFYGPDSAGPVRRGWRRLLPWRGGLSAVSPFTFSIFIMTLLLSLVSFVGTQTLRQFNADSRHWYALVNVARLQSFGQKIEATFDRDGVTLLIGTRSKEAPPPERQNQLAALQPVTANLRDADGAVRPTLFTPLVQIPADRVLRLRAALPNLLDAPDADLEQLVWHPACEGQTECVSRADVILAEEFVYTLSGIQTEHNILNALLRPVEGPDRDAPAPKFEWPKKCAIANPMQSMPQGQFVRAGAIIQQPAVLNAIFLSILCSKLPMPINLPPPLHSLVTMDFRADLALRVLNTYVLTLLFGLLGACVHVTRDMNRRLDDFTMTRSVRSRYWARIILGGVSGAFIGLFFNAGGELETVSSASTSPGTITTHLTGLTLAFLAGFSVEILFAILDRFTQVFRDFAYGADAARVQAPGAGPAVRNVKVQ